MLEEPKPPTSLEQLHATRSRTTWALLLVLDFLKNILLFIRSIIDGEVRMSELHRHVWNIYVAPFIFEANNVLVGNSSKSQDSKQSETIKSNVAKPVQQILNSSLRDLCRAIVQRDIAKISRILDAAPILASTMHNNGWYPIHTAVLTGNLDIVKLIASQPGVDLGKLDTYNYGSSITEEEYRIREEELSPRLKTVKAKNTSVLHYACMIGNMDVIKFLFENGASPGAVDFMSATPIEYFDAERTEDLKAFSELQEKWRIREESIQTVNTAVLERKIRKRDYEGFKRLLKLKPGVLKEKCYYDFYLLHMATIRCLPQFVKLIIETDPSTVNVKDRRSCDTSSSAFAAFATDKYPHKSVRDATALHYACLSENLETIELLLKSGADWNVTDNKGRKPEDLIQDDAVEEQFARLRAEEEVIRKAKEAEKASKPESIDEKAGSKEDDKASEEDSDSDSDVDSDESDADSKSELKMKRAREKEKEAALKAREAAFALEKVLGERVIGQRGPIRTVANAIRLRENGWVDPDRPLVMLFLGSSGVGKTEVAKQVALYIHGKESTSTKQSELVNDMEKKCGFIRIDMSEYQHSHTVSNLTGSPKGYVGYEEGGYLTGRLAKNPKAIVLIDEIEKAHPDVLTVFLQVFDDGRITDPKRGVIYCKDATFIMTSNLASDEIKRKSPYLRKIVAETEAQGRPEEYMRLVGDFNRKIHPILKDALRRDEFLGRINQIVVFLPLDEEEISVVINGELKVWKRRAEEKHGIRLSWSREAVEKLTKSYDLNYGVRSVMHEVQRIAIQLIADAQIRGELHKGWLTHLTTNEHGDCLLKSMNSTESVKSRRGCRLHYH